MKRVVPIAYDAEGALLYERGMSPAYRSAARCSPVWHARWRIKNRRHTERLCRSPRARRLADLRRAWAQERRRCEWQGTACLHCTPEKCCALHDIPF